MADVNTLRQLGGIERQVHRLATLVDATLSEPDFPREHAEQVNLAVMRMLLVHALSQYDIATSIPLTELLSERCSRAGESYTQFLNMFSTRQRRPIQKRSLEEPLDYEDCLSLSPLALDVSEGYVGHLLSDNQLLEFATVIDRMNLAGYGKRDPVSKATLLGNVYEFLKDRTSKKEHGIFYTPDPVASLICDLSLSTYHPTWGQTDETIDLESLECLLDLRVLDNACGSGVFLLNMLKKIVGLLQRAAQDNPKACHTLEGRGAYPDDTSTLARHVVKSNLHGRDLDKAALRIAKTQLWLAICSMDPERMPLPLPGADLVAMDSLLVDTQQASAFDIVVGNPPYMKASSLPESVRDHLRDKYPIHGEYNSHALFVQSALRQLKRDGVLAYIVHKNIFTLDSFRDLRHLLLDSYECTNLVDCGPGIFRRVTAETGIMVVRNSHPAEDSSIRLSKYVRSTSRLLPAVTFSQAEYLRVVRPWEYRYVLSISEEDRAVLSLLENTATSRQVCVDQTWNRNRKEQEIPFLVSG